MIQSFLRNKTVRKYRASWRDTIILIAEFYKPLLTFGLVMFGGGYLYKILSYGSSSQIESIIKSIYLVLGLSFLQPIVEFPKDWYLQIFFFLMPIITLAILAQGVTDFATLFFNRRSRGKEWEMAVASTYNNHIVLVGLGHLGFQVAKQLYMIGQDVVAIELNPKEDLIEGLQALGGTVITGDANIESTLESGGIKKARAIMMCTQNDSLNLQIAVKARSINPNIHVIVRIFDAEFASAIQNQFGFTALSSSSMSAPSFAAAASGYDLTRPITIEGQSLSLIKIVISPKSKLAHLSVGKVEQKFNVSVVLWKNKNEIDFHPPAEAELGIGETIAILANITDIEKVIKNN